MNNSKLAAQLFTVRDFCRSEEDIKVSMEKIAKIGYKNVQVSGLAKIPAANMRKIMDDNGLDIIVTHIGWQQFDENLDALIEEHNILGCRHAGLGSMPGAAFSRTSESGFASFGKRAEEIAQKLLEADMRFVYHNHAFEMQRFGKKTGLDLIYENAPTLQGEIDTHWIVAGGGDPVTWIEKLSGRMDLIHFKDMSADSENRRVFKEIGEGNLNWPAILAACEKAGVKWYIVEQDECEVDPFQSLEISYKNLVEMGVK